MGIAIKKTFLCSIVLTMAIYVNTSRANDRRLECMKVVNERANFVYSRISVPDLPKTGLLRTGVTVNESIMAGSTKVTRKNGGVDEFDGFLTDKAWIGGVHYFRASYHVKPPGPLPVETEAHYRELLAKRKARDPEFDIEKELERHLKGYQKTKGGILKGQLSVTVVNSPSTKAAFECLVANACDCSLMSQSIISMFAESNKLEDIGTVGYHKTLGSISFIRDNITVIIRADGEFTGDALEIARKIDKRLLKQPLYTYEQLKARCPEVTLRHKRHKVIRQKYHTPVTRPDDIFVDISVPKGKGYAITKSEVDGKGISFKKRKKAYYDDRRADKTKPLRIEMTVVTDELLVTRILHDLEISDIAEETNE